MDASSMKRNMLWNAAGNILYLLCQWVITVLVTVIGGLVDAGVLSVAMSISATCQTLAMFGIRNFQVSDTEDKYSDTCYVGLRSITCVLSLLVCLVFSLCSGYFSAQLLSILLFMLFRLAESFSDVLHGIAQKNGRLDIAGRAFAIKGVGLLICFFAGYYATRNLNVGLLCMTLFSCASTVLYDLPAARRLSAFRLWESPRGAWRLALETLPLCVYLFLSAALTTAPRLILEKQAGEAVLGAYASVSVPVLLLQVAAGYLYQPFMTSLAEYAHTRNAGGLCRLMGKVMAAILAIFAVVFLGALFFGELAMVLVFGEQIRAYAYLLYPLLVVNLLLAYLGLLATVVTVLRRLRWLLAGYIAGFLCCVLLTSPLIRRAGPNGASYGLILAALVACAVLTVCIGVTFYKWRASAAQQDTPEQQKG